MDNAQANLFETLDPQAATLGLRTRDGRAFFDGIAAADTPDARAVAFLEYLKVPEGRAAGEPLRLAPFQRRFIAGALAVDVSVAVLSVGRGNGKSALTAGLALGELLGCWDAQPRREAIAAARTREQAKIIFAYMRGLAASLPEEVQQRIIWRQAPYVEVEYRDDRGAHFVHCIAANPKNALGTSPTLAIMDERGHWPTDKGDALEAAMLSGLGKRGGKAIIISTSAASDAAPLSQWIDHPPPGCYVQEHRPQPGLPADDLDSLAIANPGALAGIGSSMEWLQSQAQLAIARGGSALASFRLYNRNERVSAESSDSLLTVDQWLKAEVTDLPERHGICVVGIDLGGSSSMSAAVLYWPETGRLEAFGAFPTNPSLGDRGLRDSVGDRYVEMYQRGELLVMGDRVVSASQFLQAVMQRLDGVTPLCFTADRFRQSEFEDAMRAANLRVPMAYRGQGFKDGGEDVERFRLAVFGGKVHATASLLLRSAFADAVTLHDPAGNAKLAKARSLGRIDAAAAAILAVAEGQRRIARPVPKSRGVVWA